MAHNALTQMNVGDISLLMPYFPGARQDRIMIGGEPFSLKVYAQLINALEFKRIHIIDPHSDVCPALLKNVNVIDNIAFVKEVLNGKTDYTLIAPDAGAMKKTYKIAQALNVSKVVECTKVRDISTGRLSSFKVNADDLENKTCVIVDDICDGGGTFIGLAKELKKKTAGPLILIVTHGIFSKGSENLKAAFDEIYTTDAFKTIQDHNIKQIALSTLLNL
jgi:ribose-phosphate pyrophosphokinase